MVEIKRVTENERTSEFINVEFTNYANMVVIKSQRGDTSGRFNEDKKEA